MHRRFHVAAASGGDRPKNPGHYVFETRLPSRTPGTCPGKSTPAAQTSMFIWLVLY